MTQKDIDIESEIGEETVVEYSTVEKHFKVDPKATSFDENESEDTTAVGGPS